MKICNKNLEKKFIQSFIKITKDKNLNIGKSNCRIFPKKKKRFNFINYESKQLLHSQTN